MLARAAFDWLRVVAARRQTTTRAAVLAAAAIGLTLTGAAPAACEDVLRSPEVHPPARRACRVTRPRLGHVDDR